jgi:hypothetical protein
MVQYQIGLTKQNKTKNKTNQTKTKQKKRLIINKSLALGLPP